MKKILFLLTLITACAESGVAPEMAADAGSYKAIMKNYDNQSFSLKNYNLKSNVKSVDEYIGDDDAKQLYYSYSFNRDGMITNKTNHYQLIHDIIHGFGDTITYKYEYTYTDFGTMDKYYSIAADITNPTEDGYEEVASLAAQYFYTETQLDSIVDKYSCTYYSYYSDGLVSKTINNLGYSTQYSYDDDKLMITMNVSSEYGEYSISLEYNTSGELIGNSYSNDEYGSSAEFKNGILINSSSTSPETENPTSISYKLDVNGNTTEFVNIHPSYYDTGLMDTTTIYYEYEYDSHKNWTKKITKGSPDDDGYSTFREITYY